MNLPPLPLFNSTPIAIMLQGFVTQARSSTLLVLLTCIALFALGQFHRASGSIFSPILIDQLSLSATAIGVLTGALFLANICAQTPVGAALDRLGPRAMLAGGVLLTAIGTCWFAVADDYWGFLLSRVLIGLGLTTGGPGTYVVVARSFPSKQFGFINGMIASLGGIGGLLGTYPLSLAFASFAWSTVFFWVTAVTMGLFILTLLTIEGEKSDEDAKLRANAERAGYVELLKSPELRKILALAVVTFAPITTITGLWGGPYFQQIHQVTPEASGGIIFLLFGSATIAAMIFGFLDRSIQSRKLLVLSAVWISVLCLLGVVVIPDPSLYLAVGLFLIMVFCQNFYIPLIAHLRRVVPDSSLGRASTLLLLVAVAGIPLMQALFGAIIDLSLYLGLDQQQAFRASFAYMALALLISGLVYARVEQADG